MDTINKDIYFKVIVQSESIYRRFLDSVRMELGRLGTRGVTGTQILILQCIGRKQVTINELNNCGRYFGTNISSTIGKMITNKYLERIPSANDHRLHYIKLSTLGSKIVTDLEKIIEKQSQELQTIVDSDDLKNIVEVQKKLDIFLMHSLRD